MAPGGQKFFFHLIIDEGENKGRERTEVAILPFLESIAVEFGRGLRRRVGEGFHVAAEFDGVLLRG